MMAGLGLAAWLAVPRANLLAQTPPPKPAPDTLVLSDDEKLVGHFLRSNGGDVRFKSDMLGEVTIPWSKVKELQANGTYTVVGKDIKLGRSSDTSKLPKGSLEATANEITVTGVPGAAPQTVAVADAAHVIESSEFEQQVMHSPGIGEDWTGSINAGATLVEATQQSRTFSAGFALARAVPMESWLDPRDRTLVGFNFASGVVKQPGAAEIKTDIIHGGLERDEYFSTRRMYGFAQATLDHNYSQGLDLGSQVGGGIGWTVVKSAANVLDAKASMTYLHQSFSGPGNVDQSLAASNFAEAFTHKFKHGVLLAQTVSATPAWNITNDWLANASIALTVPAYKRLNIALGAIDSYLNNPPPSFKKNSFQLTTGLTYTFK
ncbi:MAG TPA: DUF481 domain-containing protein [Bryobacteraceae bacterium]|jgi:hypothetical protein